MWLLSLLLLSGWHWPTPEQVLYPSAQARLQACKTPDVAPRQPTPAELEQARTQMSRRTIFFLRPVDSLRGACTRTAPRYPNVAKTAQDFEQMLQSEQAPPALAMIALFAPIKNFGEVKHWQAWLVLKDAKGRELTRWKPYNGMTRQLVPGLGTSMLLFKPPERSVVSQASKLMVEVDWHDGKPRQIENVVTLPNR